MFAGNLKDAIEEFVCSGDLPTRKLRILPYRAPFLGGDFIYWREIESRRLTQIQG